MRSLADMQQAFANVIVSGGTTDIAFLPGPVSCEQALRVHRNTVIGALVGALRLTYPTVDRLVGEEFFDHTAAHFVQQQPPLDAHLALYGRRFADFLQSHSPAASLHYLADVARLDLAIDRAALGPGDDARQRHAIDDAVSIDMPEGLCVLALNHPADLIKDALDADDDQALAMIGLRPEPRWLVVWRVDRRIIVKPVGPAAGAFLRALLDGTPANRALAAATAHVALQAATLEIQRDVFAASFCRVETHNEEQQP